jgi:hypothetical protein
MSVTICDQINAVILDRLEAMIGNPDDYQTDFVEVVQPTRVGEFTPTDRQVLLVQGDDEILDDMSIPGNPPGICHNQKWNIRCHLLPDETSGEDIVNQAAADIIKAITTPNDSWHNMDGLALDSKIDAPVFVSFDGGPDGVSIVLSVMYRVSEYSPYVSRL